MSVKKFRRFAVGERQGAPQKLEVPLKSDEITRMLGESSITYSRGNIHAILRKYQVLNVQAFVAEVLGCGRQRLLCLLIPKRFRKRLDNYRYRCYGMQALVANKLYSNQEYRLFYHTAAMTSLTRLETEYMASSDQDDLRDIQKALGCLERLRTLKKLHAVLSGGERAAMALAQACSSLTALEVCRPECLLALTL